jgi:dihydroxyacid dehydratase/phosphogluconate dehydratase
VPEALDGGPIALVKEGDLIEINIPERRLAIVGTGGERRSPETIDATLARRRRSWKPPKSRHDTGILSLYERVARSAAEGASIT